MLTKKQKYCPYCHVGSDIKSEDGPTAWDDGELRFDIIESDPNVQNDGLVYADMDFDPKLHTLTVWGDGVDPLRINIAYCPMCGRKLEDDL